MIHNGATAALLAGRKRTETVVTWPAHLHCVKLLPTGDAKLMGRQEESPKYGIKMGEGATVGAVKQRNNQRLT